MNHAAEELLIIFEKEAEQWATYLCSVFKGSISAEGICCYDIGTVSSRRDDFLRLGQYSCKLLILSKGMLEGLCQMRRFFLARVLSPAARVVVLLCGVDSLTPLLELVPLNGDECLQISSEQEADEYLSAVTDIVRKGLSVPVSNVSPLTRKSSGAELKMEQMESAAGHSVESAVVLVPSRVPCGSSMEVFLLLRNESAATVSEVEFSKDNEMFKVKPTHWTDSILCVKAPDFPEGSVKVTVFSNGVAWNKTELVYYSNMEEIKCLLSKVANPVQFMCQALRVSSVDKLDQTLSSILLRGMPSGGFQGLPWKGTPEIEAHHSEVPTLLHFAAQYGLKNLSSVLLQCPGAERAVLTTNGHGHTPIQIARNNGHKELHVLLKETLRIFNPGEDNGDTSVYEMMCAAGSASTANIQKEQQEEDEEEEEEDPYAALRVSDEYDTIVTSTQHTVVIANRPPAPTPRPESTSVNEDRTPYIAKVLQQKKKQSNSDLYSLPTKQAQGQEDMSSTYDTFVANQIPGLQQLTLLPQRVRAGSLTVEEALERLHDWQRVQKGMNAIQQDKLSQLRASIINHRVNDSVYDKINIVHHTPSAVGNENRRKSQPEKSDFYSKPLKGHHANFFWKADKR